jgi:hypothetical protein
LPGSVPSNHSAPVTAVRLSFAVAARLTAVVVRMTWFGVALAAVTAGPDRSTTKDSGASGPQLPAASLACT